MRSDDLYDAFRSDVVDLAQPHLWTDDEVFRYMNAAYREFVRLIGGISDFTSEACQVSMVQGEATSELHPSLLRIMQMSRASDYAQIQVINFTDIGKSRVQDYGVTRNLKLDDHRGPVTHGVIGMQKGVVRWVSIPEFDDTANLVIKRLPFETIKGFGQEFTDLDEDHHTHLLEGMKQYAYLKQDADAFDRGRSDLNKALFENYALRVKGELERYQHKNRGVFYGGI